MDPSTITRALRDIAEQDSLTLRISGNCMSPLIEDGAMVRIKPARTYWPGDVLVFHGRSGDRLMAHRFLGCYPRGRRLFFLTQGDASERPDSPVERHHILGRVCGGNCAREAIDIPARQRLRAMMTFLEFVLRRALALTNKQ